jgi:hypothetical protein
VVVITAAGRQSAELSNNVFSIVVKEAPNEVQWVDAAGRQRGQRFEHLPKAS